ncbi:hypothetical protein FEM48_Zijuj11G0156100 [Ziziphus jujuba var. spinosa]|uniref:23 kDa jasmonate-induced protein-like n=1 Tax=Ziziphus jujuba var. spinosa TaxID=714518 RepID=A0A978UJT0_ZIZJJ|nr:hypothetical protein FEM48_Zijuj11G0156100 [Ziziphus jujuba var. spinosa]
MKNADDKDVNARKFVESLKPKYGVLVVTTTCLIYNATGNRLTYVGSHDWQGHIGDSPYPLVLENGQWNAFLHVCTEIRVADHYKGINWSSIYDYKLSKFYQYSNDMWNGCYSSVITGYSDVIDVNTANSICPIFEGIMTLKKAWIQ